MPFALPERFNLATHLLDARLDEGRGDRVALHLDDRDVTYAEVAGASHRVARALSDLGVQEEQRLLLSCADGLDYVAALFATLRIGAVVVMVNPQLPRDHLAAIFRSSRAPVAVVDATTAPAFHEAATVATRSPRLLVTDDRGGDHASLLDATDDSAVPTADTHRDDAAIWLFSGGTTGAPKAVVQTHRSYANTTACYARDALGYHQDDVTVAVPKLYFGYATGSNLFFPFSVGAASVLFAGPPTPQALLDRIERHRASILITTPKSVAQVLDAGVEGRDLSSLRFATSAGEALPAALYDRWTEATGVELLDGLGTAEMWHIFVSNLPGAVKPGTLGRTVPGFEVEVRDADGHRVPRGDVGRLWVTGDSLAWGYWQDRDRTADAFVGPWYASSDLVSQDDDGYITYVGRADDAMKVGGKWLLPADVEGVLLDHPQVTEVAVVGATNADGLTVPVAFVVTAGDVTDQQLQAFVLERLEPYKHPREVHRLDGLPRTHLGKVNRGELRTLAGGA